MAFFEQDFVMRQIQHLTQVLQQILFKKKQNQYEEAEQQIHDAFQSLTKDHPKKFHELSLEETLQLFKQDQIYEADLAIAVADLLVEEGNITAKKEFSQSQQSYAQALLLYKKSLRNPSDIVPVDIHGKIETLERELEDSNIPIRINQLLNKTDS